MSNGSAGRWNAAICISVAFSFATPALMLPSTVEPGRLTTADSISSRNATAECGFTDDPLVTGSSVIRAVHITELRARIDALRGPHASLGAYSYANAIQPGLSVVQARDIIEMRQALQDVHVARGLPSPQYGTSPAVGASIVAADIASLRTAVLGIELSSGSAMHFGSDIAQADRSNICLAYWLSEGFWGGSAISVFSYSTIDGVIAAYVEACGCSAHADTRRSLESEFGATAPNAVMLWVADGFHAFNRETLIGPFMMHTMHHAMQRGFTNGFIGPVWMTEGGAEYADAHGGIRNVEALHQFLRNEALGFTFTLAELESYGSQSGFDQPFGRAPYGLGHFATDLLVRRSGRSAILAYWRTLGLNLTSGMDPDAAWRTAFQSVFGVSVADFYAEFEGYRSGGFL